MKPGIPPLGSGSVHVWAGRLDGSPELDGEWLSAAELARTDSYRFSADRKRYLLQRTMLRGLLGEYLETDPASIEFATGEFDKPHVAFPTTTIEFNCSRSGELALCAFSRDHEVGVDVEVVRADLDLELMARPVFSAADIAAMSAVPEERRAECFFDLWTRKEAAAKLRGEGLNADMKTVDGSGVSLLKLTVPECYVAHLATARPVAAVRVMNWNEHG